MHNNSKIARVVIYIGLILWLLVNLWLLLRPASTRNKAEETA